jgi:hypothetical protein
VCQLGHDSDPSAIPQQWSIGYSVLACFVDFLRPGQIDWRTPNPNDMQLVAKLLGNFVDSKDTDKQRKLLRGLFNLYCLYAAELLKIPLKMACFGRWMDAAQGNWTPGTIDNVWL